MVHIRTILTLYIVILAINNVLVEAGQGTKNRQENLKERASTHKNVLKKYEDRFTNKFGFSMNPQIEKKLTYISYIIIDHIMVHESFSLYLKSVFEVLRKYAVRQINSRFVKLNKIYKKWGKKNFPDKNKKADALKILNNQEKENKNYPEKGNKNNQEKEKKGLEKKNSGNEKKPKKKGDKKSIDKKGGQKKNGK